MSWEHLSALSILRSRLQKTPRSSEIPHGLDCFKVLMGNLRTPGLLEDSPEYDGTTSSTPATWASSFASHSGSVARWKSTDLAVLNMKNISPILTKTLKLVQHFGVLHSAVTLPLGHTSFIPKKPLREACLPRPEKPQVTTSACGGRCIHLAS